MSRQGFTLVELMVVLALIGILVGLAIPQYSKLSAKSRRAEMSVTLTAIDALEKAFAAETGSFSQCLGSIGYGRSGTQFYYSVGFPSQVWSGCGPDGTRPCNEYQWPVNGAPSVCSAGENQFYFRATLKADGVIYSGADFPVGSVSRGGFEAVAMGNIFKTFPDTWTIDQNKTVKMIANGMGP